MGIKICRNYLFILGIIVFIFFITPSTFGEDSYNKYKGKDHVLERVCGNKKP